MGRAIAAIRGFLERWAARGTERLAPPAVVRLRTFNLITLAVGLGGLFYLVGFLCVGGAWAPLAWIRLAALLWYAAVPFIVVRQKRPFAQVGTLLLANCCLVAVALVTGRQAGVHLLLFPMVTFPLMIFEPRQRGLLASTMAMPLVARMCFEVLAPSEPHVMSQRFYVLLVIQAFILLILPLLAFVREMWRYQTELENATAALRVENQLRAKAERELEVSRRTEAMGRLASGIAHEINTPLQYISDNVTFAGQSAEQLIGLVNRLDALLRDPSARTGDLDLAAAADRARADADLDFVQQQLPPALDHALAGLDRLAEIVRSMKELAHPDVKNMVEVDINRLINNALIVARNEYKNVADASAELGEIPRVMCHAGEIGQVLLNLVVNAAHAIADQVHGTATRGQITIRSELDGESVVISVQDTGTGVPEAVADRIFEPFFTTKPLGKGTGQGLAISHAIVVRRHGGTLDFHSAPGRGTTFRVRLPIRQEQRRTPDPALAMTPG